MNAPIELATCTHTTARARAHTHAHDTSCVQPVYSGRCDPPVARDRFQHAHRHRSEQVNISSKTAPEALDEGRDSSLLMLSMQGFTQWNVRACVEPVGWYIPLIRARTNSIKRTRGGKDYYNHHTDFSIIKMSFLE